MIRENKECWVAASSAKLEVGDEKPYHMYFHSSSIRTAVILQYDGKAS